MKQHLPAILLLAACCTALTACTGQTAPPPEPPESAPISSAEPAAAESAEPFDACGMHFSAKSGFYETGFSLTVTASDGVRIYYTTDGSEPTANSTLYTAPIEIADRSAEPNTLSARTDIAPDTSEPPVAAPESPVDKATVLRFTAVGADGVASPVVTNTYFIGYGTKNAYYRDLKVFSLVTDAQNLYDRSTGIFVLGDVYDNWKSSAEYDPETPPWSTPANYTQSGRAWERPACLQIFGQNGIELSQDIGIRVHGGATRSYAQKSLNIYARKDYSSGKLTNDLFSGTVTDASGQPLTEFDTFMIRNGGNDALFTRFRDKLNQALSADRAFLTQGMSPCIVFLNGEYWGHYEITEKLDAAFIHAHTGIPKKNICIVKKEALDAGSEETFAQWEKLRGWIRTTDFSDPARYEQLCGYIDMQSFMDYVSAELYINNANWDKSNMAMWRCEDADDSSPYADGKWRFIMFDTDYSTGIYGEALASDDSFAKLEKSGCFLAELLAAACQNDSFRKQFRTTFLEIAEQNFCAQRVSGMIDRLAEDYHDLTIDTYQRFWSESPGGADAEEHYAREVESVRQFFRMRAQYMKQYLDQHIEAP